MGAGSCLPVDSVPPTRVTTLGVEAPPVVVEHVQAVPLDECPP